MLDDIPDYSNRSATFGDRLTAAREAAGLSQADLARRLGVRAATIRDWETDRSEPRANRLAMLAGMLNVSLSWLLTGEGDGPPVAVAAGESDALPGTLRAELRGLRAACREMEARLERLERQLEDTASAG